jgi:hypothetical protein
MKKIKKVLGYILACLSILIALATFFGMPYFSRTLAASTGITISPWFTGGEVVRIVDHVGYRTSIRRPVFEALIGEKKKGFLQVDWTPQAPDSLPLLVEEEIDYNGDGVTDFKVKLDTKNLEVSLTPLNPQIDGLPKVYHLDKSIALRVPLRNDKK